MPREWRPEARAHQVQGRAIGHPDLVPDVVCPGVGQLLISRLGAVALHLQQVHVLDVGVVVGKRAVDIAHPVKGRAVAIGEVVRPGCPDELELVTEAVNVAHDLPEPGGINPVFILGQRNPGPRRSAGRFGLSRRSSKQAESERKGSDQGVFEG